MSGASEFVNQFAKSTDASPVNFAMFASDDVKIFSAATSGRPAVGMTATDVAKKCSQNSATDRKLGIDGSSDDPSSRCEDSELDRRPPLLGFDSALTGAPPGPGWPRRTLAPVPC